MQACAVDISWIDDIHAPVCLEIYYKVYMYSMHGFYVAIFEW